MYKVQLETTVRMRRKGVKIAHLFIECGERHCLMGSGRSRVLRYLRSGIVEVNYIGRESKDFLADFREAITRNGVIIVDKLERHLDAEGRKTLASELVGSGCTAIFTTNDIAFINSVATNLTDISGASMPGNWQNYMSTLIAAKILRRSRGAPMPVARFPACPTGQLDMCTTLRGQRLRISSSGGVFLFSGQAKSEALEELFSRMSAGNPGAVGYYCGPHAGDLSPACSAVIAAGGSAILGIDILRALGVPTCSTISMSTAERSCVALSIALSFTVTLLADPTKYLHIDQIYGLREHLRGRIAIITSEDSEFIRMLNPEIISF